MKKIKLILFICMIFVLTGCSLEYNLTINEDNSINEKVVASEKTNKMKTLTRLNEDESVNYLFNMFKRNNEKINISSKSESGLTTATATTNHESIEDYSNKFTSDVFEKAIVTKNDGIVTLTINQSEMLSKSSSNSLIYDDIKVNIIVPFKVIDHNADKTHGDTYTWQINKDEDLKNIKISYDENKMRNSLNLKLNEKTYNINYGIIVISVIIVLLLISLLVVYKKNKKNNSF